MIKLATLLLIFILSSCSKDKAEPDLTSDTYVCLTQTVQNNYNRTQVIQSFDETIIQGIASIDVPDIDGAMGRNKDGYFHVRFQMGISGQADLATYSENVQALEYAIKSIEYSFQHQTANGDFQYIIPSDLSGQSPNDADLASGVSFFLSSLGLALNNFDQSTWYNSASMLTYKSRIETLRPDIENASLWLLTKKNVLEIADENAPNRLLFNALAYYSLGKWLENDELKTTGIYFANKAISKQHPNGYFIEGDGWDSSYQGVGINVGFNLYSLLPDSEPLKTTLWDCLSCATNWQKSRILVSGEISTQGNTRVYPGGEGFLGEEKRVDWLDTMIGFFMMSYLSNDSSYEIKANEIKNFYYP